MAMVTMGLAELLTELPSRPMHVDADGEYRLSLAGAQDKLPVLCGRQRAGIGLTRGQTPSTHIIKTPIQRLDHTVINEAFCPMVGRELGVDVVDALSATSGRAGLPAGQALRPTRIR